ncbi:MAG: N-acetyl-gamma-glutamyl-phosphate reductase [Salinivirgaceae bacterium]|nr:N-acetyl-gamma-glutamyl-phosphate reductase [Salinivirgaceae bacterium]
MIKVGIIGGAGYTAGELIRILISHPKAELTSIQSSSHANENITKVHRDLLGETDLKFSVDLEAYVDVLFLCGGHGKSEQALEKYKISDTTKIIDLSADFRLADPSHDFVYGSPEKSRDEIAKCKHLANPGCFATSIELAFLPLAQNKLLTSELNVTAITGSTGAGQNPTSTSHFSWKNNNVSVYKAFTHQHLAEIRQTLFFDGEKEQPISFIPVRGNFSRGIMATCVTDSDKSIEELYELYEEFYRDHPFVVVTDMNPDLKMVVNTNKCVLHLVKNGSKVLIISVIDNLLKGASGQAVENMNIMFGQERTLGLRLKPVAF